MFDNLVTLALAPILFFQGRRVRLSTPRLPEPPGDRAGVQGEGTLLRLLILGDSAAAGVGASHQSEALSGNLIAELSADYRLDWRLIAKTGATTQSTLKAREKLTDETFDIVVLSLGVNDVTGQVALPTWLEQQRSLRSWCFNTLGAKLVISSGLPLMGQFPALPQPLRWYLGRRANQFDGALKRELDKVQSSEYSSLRFSSTPDLMASDGFHPGPEIYAEWAKRVAQSIRSSFSTAS